MADIVENCSPGRKLVTEFDALDKRNTDFNSYLLSDPKLTFNVFDRNGHGQLQERFSWHGW